MHPEVGVYLQTEDWNDDDAHPNYIEMSTRRTLRLIIQVWIMCAFTWFNCIWHLFHQSKLKAVAHLSSLSTWYSQADPGLGPHTTGAIPRRQAEALHRRALAGREAHLGANHPHTLQSMNNLATLLEQQGKLNEAGLRYLDGERWPSWRTLHIFGLTKAWGLHFLLVSRYCWNDVTSDSFMQLFIIVAGFFVCICTCFCFPHLLTMCPPSAKSHESIV